MDGAALVSVQVAQDKAYTAVGFGLATDAWHDFVKDDPPLAMGAAPGIDRLIVFGGGGVGLMGEVARAARDAGAPVIGVLPAFLRSLEPPLKSAEELIITPDLQQRKTRMLALTDAFVILPSGLGTLDEYFEVITTTQLRVHAKPIIVINVEGYFDPLKALLDRVVEQGFARMEIASYHEFVATPAEATERLKLLLGVRVL